MRNRESGPQPGRARDVSEKDRIMILAGDIGGTNSRLASFEVVQERVKPIVEETFPSRGSASLDDIVRAVASKMFSPTDGATAVLGTHTEKTFNVILMDPFDKAAPDQQITVTVNWRTATKRLLADSRTVDTTTVENIRELKRAAERNRGRGNKT